MNADLEETLKELGPDYREVVDRLRSAQTAVPEAAPVRTRRPLRIAWWTAGALAAASLAVLCSLVRPDLAPAAESTAPLALQDGGAPAPSASPSIPYTLALAQTPAAIEEIVRTQAPDGSWQSDYLTQQNAAALRGVSSAAVAYRKAVRYLRTKGLSPLSESELKARGGQLRRA